MSDSSGATGNYKLTVLLNAAFEEEPFTAVPNHDLASAENLSLAFLDLGRLNASVVSVLGTGDGGNLFLESQTQNDVVFSPNVLAYDFISVPAPADEATLTVTAIADLDLTSEFLLLDAEGLFSVNLFVTGGLQFGLVSSTITIPLATLAALAADGTISFTVTPSSAVDSLSSSSQLTLELEYAPAGGGTEDWFRFNLEDGQSASMFWEGISTSETSIELYDSAANLLATSVSGVNVDQLITNYLDVTSDGAEDSYYVRVASAVDDYKLIVVRGADFDQELNNDFTTAQDISDTEGALGHIVGAPPVSGSGGSSTTGGGSSSSPSALPPLVNPKDLVLSDEVRQALLWFGGHDPYTPVDNSDLDVANEVGVLTAGVPVFSTGTSEIPVIQTFAGPGYTGFIPPDPTVAVGPEQVVAMVNTELAIYEKSTGNLLFQENLNFGSGFFGSVGATDVVFDPWILFDTETDRFFAMAIDVTGSTSNVFLAVSKDATPTDGDDWHKYKIDFTHDPTGTGLGSENHFPDYPKLGVSSDEIWISGNYFPISIGSGVYAGITALEKTPLLSGGGANIVYEEHFSGFSVMPMQQYGATNTQYFAEANVSGGSTITIHAISDVLTTPTRTTSTIAVPTYAFPPDVPQLGGGTPADSIDSRIMTGIWRDNSMWFAHAALDPVMGDGETLVRWYEVATNGFPNSGSPVLVQSGNVDAGPGVYAWMPAINVDAAGNMGIGFSLGGPNQYFGAGFTGRTAVDPLGQTTFPVTEYVVGQDNYVNGSPRNRWGDYSGLALDPSDDATFWAFNEYTAFGNVWATQIASFQIAEPAAVVDEDWFRFEVNSGDILRIETFTPSEGPFEFLNELDPSIELYDPAGSLVPHANGVGNELLFHAAAATGTYRVRVFSDNSSKGEYFLQVEGAAGGSLPPVVVNSIPADGIPVPDFPATYTVDFSEALLLPTIQASDLNVNGISALSVHVIDGNTLEFEIDPAVNVGDGIYTVEIAAGAVEDLQGAGNLLYTVTFEFDTTGPVILSTLWNGLPFRFSHIYEEGSLTFEALFNEDLFVLSSARLGPFTPGVDDVILVDSITGTTFAPLTVDFDATTDLLTASFDFLPEGAYTLTLLSGDGSFEDRVGNDLDGEPLGPGFDGTVTGDGINGGDYTHSFSVDRISTDINPFVRLEPFGSLVAGSADNTGYINAAGDQDLFAFFAEGGQNVTAVLTPTNPATTLSLELLALGGPVVAAGAGLPVVLDSIALPADAFFQLRASGDIPTGYRLDVFRNASAEVAVGDTDVGNELALDSSFLSLGSGRYAVVGHSSALPPASTLLPNGSFETGDLSGWTMDTTGVPFIPWSVSSTGGAGFGMDPVQPQDGLFAAWNGFDGGGPMEFTLYQDVVLPAGLSSLDLQLQDRLQWNFGSGGVALLPRLYDVEIRDPASDAVLDTLFSFSTGTQATAPTGDTGWQTHTADLMAFAGQQVRIYFREQIPENFTGPAQFELDGVSLLLGAGGSSIDVDRYTIDLSSHVGQSMDFILSGIGAGDFSEELLELLDDTGAVVTVASAEPLGKGTAVENYDLGILDFVVPNIGSNIYTLQLTTSAAGDYGILLTEDLVFDTEPNNSTSSPIRDLDDIKTALGFLQLELTVVSGVVEPDDFSVGTNLEMAVPGVTLSVIGGGTVTSQSSPFPPTGTNVFGNDIFGALWGESSAVLRADFDAPTDLVSIVIGSDDSSDRSFLRAFDANDSLLEEVLSNFLGTGQSQTLTVSRGTTDIAYVTASGIGGDATILDRLEFASTAPTLPGDLYTVHLAAGQTLTAYSEIPLFDHPLTEPLNNLDPELTILDPNGNVLETDADSLDGRNALLDITADAAGDYYVRIGATSGEGEYLLHVEEGPLPADFDSSGTVSGFDFLAWQLGFGMTSGAIKSDGDSDGDGDVDSQDLHAWEESLGEEGSVPASTTPLPEPLLADFDNSGEVNGNDFLAWQLNFGMASEATSGNGDSVGDRDARDLADWEVSYGSGVGPLMANSVARVSTSLATVVSGVTADGSLTSSPVASPVNSADLIDAVFALVLTSDSTDDEEALVDDQLTLAEATYDSAFAFDDIVPVPPVSAQVDSLATRSTHVEDTDDQWLGDELLERVFG